MFCSVCGGTGSPTFGNIIFLIPLHRCYHCNGTGEEPEKEQQAGGEER